MVIREERARPNSWAKHKHSIRHAWSVPWHAIEFAFQWTAYLLSRWAFLAVLEYMGIFSVLFAVPIFVIAAWKAAISNTPTCAPRIFEEPI